MYDVNYAKKVCMYIFRRNTWKFRTDTLLAPKMSKAIK